MIYFLLDKTNSFTIRNYKSYRGRDISDRIGIILYEEIEMLNNLEATTIIFSDLDRLTHVQLQKVRMLAEKLEIKYPELHILNDPRKVKRRYDLLRAMFSEGINSFNVYRLNENLDNITYPVFLREENNHTGSLTKLIFSEKELKRNMVAKRLLGYSGKDLLVVEYCNVYNKQGISNKYSAVNLNGRIVPRYFELSKGWMVKSDDAFADVPVEKKVSEYWKFLTENPHKDILEKVFTIAGISYGRIDYSIKDTDGQKIEVWEINLNPAYYGANRTYHPEINKIYDYSHIKMKEEFLSLDSAKPCRIRDVVSLDLGKQLKPDYWKERLRIFHNHLSTKQKFLKLVVNLLTGLSYSVAYVIVLFCKNKS